MLGGWLLHRYYGLNFGWENYHVATDYFHHNLLGNLVLSSFVLAWTGVCFFLALRLPELVLRTLSRWSRNITVMYVIHWMIIAWSVVIYPVPLSLPWVLVYFLLLVPITDWAAVQYTALKAKLSTGGRTGQAAAQ